jgi:hypothetical protein
MNRLKSILLFYLSFFLLVCTAYTQVSKIQAIDIVMNNVVSIDSLNYNVY